MRPPKGPGRWGGTVVHGESFGGAGGGPASEEAIPRRSGSRRPRPGGGPIPRNPASLAAMEASRRVWGRPGRRPLPWHGGADGRDGEHPRAEGRRRAVRNGKGKDACPWQTSFPFAAGPHLQPPSGRRPRYPGERKGGGARPALPDAHGSASWSAAWAVCNRSAFKRAEKAGASPASRLWARGRPAAPAVRPPSRGRPSRRASYSLSPMP